MAFEGGKNVASVYTWDSRSGKRSPGDVDHFSRCSCWEDLMHGAFGGTIAKRSKFKILRERSQRYMWISCSGTPLLVQVLILGYGVPQLVSCYHGDAV